MKDRRKPRVFEYTHYRDYLRDLFEHLKSTRTSYSYRVFSRMAGFGSPNALRRVINGERPLTPNAARRFAKAFGINPEETGFLLKLVDFNEAKIPSDRAKAAEELLKSRTFRKVFPKAEWLYRYYERESHLVIHQLLFHPEFQENPAQIADILIPPITPKQVELGLELLMHLGLAQRSHDGKLHAPNTATISTGENFSSATVVRYHKKMLQLAAESLDRFPQELRDISSVTVTFPESKLPELKEILKNTRKTVLALAQAQTPQSDDRVFQFNFQIFPLTKKIKDSGD